MFFPSEELSDTRVVSMANIFHEARSKLYLTNEVRRFVTGIHVSRQQFFAYLSKEGHLNPLKVALGQL